MTKRVVTLITVKRSLWISVQTLDRPLLWVMTRTCFTVVHGTHSCTAVTVQDRQPPNDTLQWCPRIQTVIIKSVCHGNTESHVRDWSNKPRIRACDTYRRQSTTWRLHGWQTCVQRELVELSPSHRPTQTQQRSATQTIGTSEPNNWRDVDPLLWHPTQLSPHTQHLLIFNLNQKSTFTLERLVCCKLASGTKCPKRTFTEDMHHFFEALKFSKLDLQHSEQKMAHPYTCQGQRSHQFRFFHACLFLS